jgi:predicted transcriptional regulator
MMAFLKSTDQWLTAYEIADCLKISPNKVRRVLSSAIFNEVAKGIHDTGKPNGGRYVSVYKFISKEKTNIEDALQLAKKHTGIWGQLAWSNQPKIELIER